MKALLSSGAALAAIIVIAGCGGSGGDTPTAGGAASGKTVSTQSIAGAGTVLVSRAGMALYAPDQEKKGGMILCTDSCTSIWKPLTIASGKPTGPGDLGVVKRPDGTRQVTADGHPLYTFAEDQAGKVTGNGFKDSFGGRSFTWHAITAAGKPSTGASSSSGGSSSSSGGGQGGYGY